MRSAGRGVGQMAGEEELLVYDSGPEVVAPARAPGGERAKALSANASGTDEILSKSKGDRAKALSARLDSEGVESRARAPQPQRRELSRPSAEVGKPTSADTRGRAGPVKAVAGSKAKGSQGNATSQQRDEKGRIDQTVANTRQTVNYGQMSFSQSDSGDSEGLFDWDDDEDSDDEDDIAAQMDGSDERPAKWGSGAGYSAPPAPAETPGRPLQEQRKRFAETAIRNPTSAQAKAEFQDFEWEQMLPVKHSSPWRIPKEGCTLSMRDRVFVNKAITFGWFDEGFDCPSGWLLNRWDATTDREDAWPVMGTEQQRANSMGLSRPQYAARHGLQLPFSKSNWDKARVLYVQYVLDAQRGPEPTVHMGGLEVAGFNATAWAPEADTVDGAPMEQVQVEARPKDPNTQTLEQPVAQGGKWGTTDAPLEARGDGDHATVGPPVGERRGRPSRRSRSPPRRGSRRSRSRSPQRGYTRRSRSGSPPHGRSTSTRRPQSPMGRGRESYDARRRARSRSPTERRGEERGGRYDIREVV